MAPSKAALLRAEESIQATLAQADQVVSLGDRDGHIASKELLHVLELADKEVAARLVKISPKPNGDMKFTAAQAISYRTQIQVTIEKVKLKINPIAVDVGQAAMSKAIKSGAKTLAALERDFKGVSTSPRILAAMQQSHVLRGPNASLVTRVATSLDRYGMEMGQQFARIIQSGLVSGATQDQMVAALVGHGGPKGPKVSLAAKETAPGVVKRIREGDIPEGLFVRHKYWAERIIRTETAYAFNGAKLEQLRQMKRDGLHVKKKICAHFDNRTAPDSIAVHGQVRELEATFLDGAGRQYLQPPGRPNDRETILPWFDDWAEVPSTEPPNPDELAEAEALAKPTPKGAPLVPRTTEELHQLEQEARAAAVELEQRAAGRAAQEQLNLSDDVAHAETMASQALERIAQEQLAKQAALVKAAEDAEKAAKTKQQKQDVKDIKKQDKSVGAKMLAGDEHLAHLELIQLAHEKTEKFAKFINATKVDATLPLEAITGAVKVSPPVLEALIKDALATYNDAAGVSGGNGLDLFKHSDQFPAFVQKLAVAKDAKSKKLYAALYASEGESWANALANVKELPASTAKHLIKKYEKPAPIPLEPPKPPPAAPQVYTLKSGGGTYVDVYVPNPETGGEKKIAFFHEKTSGFEVTPPLHLGMVAKTFADKALAAEYALEVGEAIAKAPKVHHKTPGKDSVFNHDPTRAPSVLGPIKLAASAAREIAALRKSARAHYQKHGVKTCDESTSHKGCVDDVLDEAGLFNQQKQWSDGIGGCWYSSSDGPKSYAGRIIAHDVKPDAGKGRDDARAMGKQVADAPDDAPKYFKYSRLKYAATQEALEHRRKAMTKLAEQVDEEGYVLLFRGIKGAQGQHLRQIREHGIETEVALRTVSSWTIERSAAVRFSGERGVVVRSRVHISRIFSQFEQESIAMRRFGYGESEWIVICEDEKESLRIQSVDIQNPKEE